MLLAAAFDVACDPELFNEVLAAIFPVLASAGFALGLVLTCVRRRNVEDIK